MTNEKEVKSFYCIRRAGTFEVTQENQESIQCGFEYHPMFFYELKVVFSGKTPLSSSGFIIAHEDLDEFIQDIYFESTCERMQQTFREDFEDYLSKFRVSDQKRYTESNGDDKSDILFTHTAGYRLRIRPTPDSIAYIDASVLYDADCSYLLTGV